MSSITLRRIIFHMLKRHAWMKKIKWDVHLITSSRKGVWHLRVMFNKSKISAKTGFIEVWVTDVTERQCHVYLRHILDKIKSDWEGNIQNDLLYQREIVLHQAWSMDKSIWVVKDTSELKHIGENPEKWFNNKNLRILDCQHLYSTNTVNVTKKEALFVILSMELTLISFHYWQW